jgi:hypothetical protein
MLQNLHSSGKHNPSGLADSLQKVLVFWSEAFAPKIKKNVTGMQNWFCNTFWLKPMIATVTLKL